MTILGLFATVGSKSSGGASSVSTSPPRKRLERDRGVGDDHPFHPIDFHNLAPGEPAGRLRARHITFELLVDQLGARSVFGLDEAKGAGPNAFF